MPGLQRARQLRRRLRDAAPRCRRTARGRAAAAARCGNARAMSRRSVRRSGACRRAGGVASSARGAGAGAAAARRRSPRRIGAARAASAGERSCVTEVIGRASAQRHLDLETAGVLLRVLAVPHHAVDQLATCASRPSAPATFGRRGGLLVDLDLVDLLRHGQIVGVFLEQAPALVLRQEPHAVGQVREVDRAVVVELHVVGVVPVLADAVVVAAQRCAGRSRRRRC